jgi:hypothetical protein
MAVSSTSYSKDNPAPPRGKSFKNKILDVIKEESLLGVSNKDDKKEVERAYLKHIATRAFDSEDQSSATLLKELLNKSYAGLKATLPSIEFEFDETEKPHEQVSKIIKAASSGQIAPDVAGIFVQCVKNATDIEQATDLKDRIEALEAMLNA